MKRMALFFFFLFVASGCEVGTDAINDAEYWWLDDPRFAEVLDQIDVQASRPLEEFGMVFLKPQGYEGEEARQRFIDRYGPVAYHLMGWHPEKFDALIQEHQGNLDFLKPDEIEPGPSVVEICESCPYEHEEGIGCDGGVGGSGGPPPPPPDPPLEFRAYTWITPTTTNPNTTLWQVSLDSYTTIISDHDALIAHESCFRRDGAPTQCNYDPEAYLRPSGPSSGQGVRFFEQHLYINGSGIICPHTFSGETTHFAKKASFFGGYQTKYVPATGGPYC